MKPLIVWSQTQILNFNKIIRIANFDKKAVHQNHFLGLFWEFLSPTIQIAIYYVIFGIRLNGQTVINTDTPYIYWMLCGIIPWFYISSSIILGASSIHSNLNLIAKTHFPVAILPTIAVIKGLTSFFTMFSIFLIIYIGTGHPPLFSWLQLVYYFCSMVLLLIAIATFTSVITVLFRDFQLIISSLMRLLFFASGAVVNVTANADKTLFKWFQLNPFVYLIEGFRDAFFARGGMFAQPFWLIYFWSFLLFILVAGIYLLNRYQSRFIEYM